MSTWDLSHALRPGLGQLKAYQAEPAQGDAALDANESPFEPPEGYKQAALELAASLDWRRYPDPDCQGLRRAAAKVYATAPEQVLAGNGSDELIGLILTTFGGPSKKLLLPTPTFSMYSLLGKVMGWQVLEEPLSDEFQLTAAFIERARQEKPDLIFLGQPNNPTGGLFEQAKLEELARLPLLLVLDEAYAEFSGQTWVSQTLKRSNVLVLRTLSKAYGLAGLRLGFVIGPALVLAELNKARLPYNIDALAQALGTMALERDVEFASARAEILKGRSRLYAALQGLTQAKVWPSDANFFLFSHPEAGRLQQALLAAGLRLRRFEGGRLEGHLRASVGSPREMERLEAALATFDSVVRAS